MSAQTIAERLRSLQAQIEQLTADIDESSESDLVFDTVTHLLGARRSVQDAIIIADGAAEVQAIAA